MRGSKAAERENEARMEETQTEEDLFICFLRLGGIFEGFSCARRQATNGSTTENDNIHTHTHQSYKALRRRKQKKTYLNLLSITTVRSFSS